MSVQWILLTKKKFIKKKGVSRKISIKVDPEGEYFVHPGKDVEKEISEKKKVYLENDV